MNELAEKTREELVSICKMRGIKGYSGKKKAELTKMIADAPATDALATDALATDALATDALATNIPAAEPTENAQKTGHTNQQYIVSNALDLLTRDDKSYRCVYLDPPYASGRDYKFADQDETAAFTDKFTPEKYREWLSTLIRLCKARLTKDGTLWFHIAAEYSFVPEQILREEFKEVEKIFWKKSHGKNTVKCKMGAVVDVLFRCYNSTPVFHLQYVPLDAYYFENSYKNKDERGLYALGSIRFDKTRSGNNYEIVHDGITYKAPYGWKIKKDEMERLISYNRIHFVRPNETRAGNLYKKLYKSECKGKPLSNLWDDISYITRTQKDPRTYPTQKPLKLLQRIISISSNEGDLVLDPTAGSGTTGVACRDLGRNCYMIDINPAAKQIFERRISGSATESSEDNDDESTQ